MNVEWLQFTLGVVIFLCGCIGVAIRIGFIVANTVSQIKLEIDSKVGRVYQRFDEYKQHLENNFVRKEMCAIMHRDNADRLIELGTKIDTQNDKLDALILKVAGIK